MRPWDWKYFCVKAVQVFFGGDGLLTGEDGAAIVFGGLRGDLVLDVTSDDGSVKAPDVHLEGKVLADEGNLVLLDGRVDDGEGVSTGGALKVFELVDGDRNSCRCAEHGGVAVGACLGEDADRKGEEQSGGEGDTIH